MALAPQLVIHVDITTAMAAVARLDQRSAQNTLRTAALAGASVIASEWRGLFRKKTEASWPGSLPRRQTGTYSRSIATVIASSSRDHATAHIGPTLSSPPYPLFLEYGTSRMPAHPIARPAFIRSQAKAQAVAIASLKTLLGIP